MMLVAYSAYITSHMYVCAYSHFMCVLGNHRSVTCHVMGHTYSTCVHKQAHNHIIQAIQTSTQYVATKQTIPNTWKTQADLFSGCGGVTNEYFFQSRQREIPIFHEDCQNSSQNIIYNIVGSRSWMNASSYTDEYNQLATLPGIYKDCTHTDNISL